MAFKRSEAVLAQLPPSYNQDQATFFAATVNFSRQLYEILEIGGGLDELARVAPIATEQSTLQVRIAALEQRLGQIAGLAPLSQTISDPPTQAEVEAVQDKVNAIIEAANA